MIKLYFLSRTIQGTDLEVIWRFCDKRDQPYRESHVSKVF